MKRAPSSLGAAADHWPTARAEDSESAGNHPNAIDSLTGAIQGWPTPRGHESGDWQRDNGVVGHERPTLSGEAALWNTPDAGVRGSHHSGDLSKTYPLLREQAKEWQTPGSDSFRGRGRGRRAEPGLDRQARLWATPQANDAFGPKTSEQIATMRERAQAGVSNLNEQVTTWATPMARDTKGKDQPNRQGAPSLPDQVNGGKGGLATGRALNPRFVEMLMGWPSGVCNYESLETESSRWWLLMRSVLSRLGW